MATKAAAKQASKDPVAVARPAPRDAPAAENPLWHAVSPQLRVRAGLKWSSTMESTSSERIQLALKVLSWRYNGTAPATDAEIGRLKSYLERDVPGMNAMEIAAAVISQELAKRKARGNSAG